MSGGESRPAGESRRAGERRRVPIACTLTPVEAGDRRDEFRSLAEAALVAAERHGDELRLRLAAAPGVADEARDLARREQACCAFLDIRVEEGEGEVVMSVGAPPEAGPVLDALHAVCTGSSPRS